MYFPGICVHFFVGAFSIFLQQRKAAMKVNLRLGSHLEGVILHFLYSFLVTDQNWTSVPLHGDISNLLRLRTQYARSLIHSLLCHLALEK